jgi:predicted permease
VRDAFVVAEIALALLLVTGSLLLVRSFSRARATDPGFRADGVLAAALALPSVEYRQAADIDRVFAEVTTQIAALPGVTAVTSSSDLPLNGGWTHLFTAEGHESEQAQGAPQDFHSLVSDGYFNALGIPILRGRAFNAVELEGRANVVMISEGMARRYWPGEDPVGRRLRWGTAQDTDSRWLTIVGVAGDVKQAALDAPTVAHTYEPFKQACQGPMSCGTRNLIVRAAVPAETLSSAIRDIVGRMDAEQPLGRTMLLTDAIDRSLAPRRFTTMLLALFAAGALVLSAIGVYGVMAYAVSQRTREIGTRLALGAAPRSILWLIVGRGARLAGLGVAIGVVASLGLTRLLTSLLFDVRASDPLTFASGAVVLALAALAACAVPAARAMRVSPLAATVDG